MRTPPWIEGSLDDFRTAGLLREVISYPTTGSGIRLGSTELINFSSNDYLALAGHERVRRAAETELRAHGASTSASRLVTGTIDLHTELEHELAQFFGCEASLVFGSGYLTNIGVIPALVERGDTIVADKFVHASIIDGALLSRAKLLRYQHNDLDQLSKLLRDLRAEKRTTKKRILVVTESVFSMDGDLAPLEEMMALASRYDALTMVDEAHAFGVFGNAGRGCLDRAKLLHQVDLVTGTFSKALGSYGGFVCCSAKLRELLVNRARSFIFSTALPPPSIAAAREALALVSQSPELGPTLLSRASYFRELLKRAHIDTLQSESQIIPLFVGDSARAVQFSSLLRESGLIGIAIRPPTVPVGKARLRLSVTLGHSEDQLRDAAEQIGAIAKANGLV